MAQKAKAITTNQFLIRLRLGWICTRMKEAITFFTAVLLPTAGKCLYLFTIGVVQEKNRSLTRQIWEHVGQHVPMVEITSLVPHQASMHLCEQATVLGNVELDELLVIVELLQARQPIECFEIGTFDGRTTLNIAANTPEEAMIYSLDLPREQIDRTAFPLDPSDLDVVDKEISGVRYRGTIWERKIQQLYGDSATFDYKSYQGKIDFVFIDGSHTYEYVLSDSRNAITLLRGGKGIILWHDYTNWPSVRKAVNFLQTTDPRFANTQYIKRTTFACLICE